MMNVEDVRNFALGLKAVTEDFPFDAETLALRVGGKIFALLPLEKQGMINLKCDPTRSATLREEFDAIKPGYHMNKKWWNTVDYTKLSAALVKELIEHSYTLVSKGLTRKIKQDLGLI
jgi:predicted DNA-binding protein (MmcQ/YjbR family)